jgi:hypothetical protein
VTVTRLPAAARAPQPWRNGGGVTHELARRGAPPGSPREFLWRASIARVSLPGPFSSFAGFARLITVIDGAGMSLRGAARADLELRPFAVHAFDGTRAVAGLLPQGPVSDLNLIYDPQLCRARLTILEQAVPMRRADCDDLLVVNLAASPLRWHCGAEGGVLERLDALWIAAREARLACDDIERAALIEIALGPGADRGRSCPASRQERLRAR